MKIIHIAAEVAPFSKVGGLGDVLGSLPKAQNRLGNIVYIITPLYGFILKNKYKLNDINLDSYVTLGDEKYTFKVFEYKCNEKYLIFFIYNENLLNSGGVYTELDGSPLKNYTRRFVFFQKAAIEFINGYLKDVDIIHCHDNHVALLPLYKKLKCGHLKAKTVFTIHNIGYQGITDIGNKEIFDLPDVYFEENGDLYWGGKINPMKTAVIHSDLITTVSPTHAREIMLSDEISSGMREIFVKHKKNLYGVLNGVDYEEWNPARDNFIYYKYSINEIGFKNKNKEQFLSEFGFEKALINRPLFGIVSRLVLQKGIDILIKAMPVVFESGCGMALLGQGDQSYEAEIKLCTEKYMGRFYCEFGFNNELAHKIYASCDYFLVPSLYEPCGITQMISMKYGTIPIVRKTGGLADTVLDINNKNGTGIVFREYTEKALIQAIKRAIDLYKNKELLIDVSKRAMRKNFSWERAAKRYIALYYKCLSGYH
ncbi:MAG: glycogen synthase [Candidatus Marinimicrobia bacterium]|nr:glycogen synthase [Candidatus Neomarinimicrobiota bacterium]